MTDILEQICRDKREHIARASAVKPFVVVDKEARAAAPPRGLAKALRAKIESGGIGLIAEIKKASPSVGLIRPHFSPKLLAQAYAESGAAYEIQMLIGFRKARVASPRPRK